VFYNWLRRYRRVHPELCVAKAKSTPVKREFHELRFDNVPMEVPCVSGIEIHYPHGVKVVIGQGGGIDMDKLFSFIKLRL
jgi:hypothetical protein